MTMRRFAAANRAIRRACARAARMVPYAGFEMPVQYAGILQEHDAVRHRAGFSIFRTWGNSS